MVETKKKEEKKTKKIVSNVISSGGFISIRLTEKNLSEMLAKNQIKTTDDTKSVYASVCRILGIRADTKKGAANKELKEMGIVNAKLVEYLKANPSIMQKLKE